MFAFVARLQISTNWTNIMIKKLLSGFAIALGLYGSGAQASVVPVGVQTNVTLSTIVSNGWTQCYAKTMDVFIGYSGENVLNSCGGDYLMMAGRATGSDTFLVAAAALRSDTIINTGMTSNTHVANGANWYYSPNWSWGFTALNDTVSLGECDTSQSPSSMCLHTVAGVGGYRINDIVSIGQNYEKVFFVMNESQNVPEPTSMALFGLALAGLAVARSRKI